MNRTIIFAGALLAFTGAAVSQASAAMPYANPAFRRASAYRAPLRPVQTRMSWAHIVGASARGFRAPARTAWRLPYRSAPAYRSTLAARPVYGYRRLTQPAHGRFASGYRVAYGRIANRGYGRIARPVVAGPAVVPPSPSAAFGAPAVVLRAPAVRRVALAPAAVAPRLAAAPVGGGQVGRASYYSGGRTASGGFVGAATCAHRSLPFGTRVLVTNMANARSTVCVVNDRGPFVGGRLVDLSRGAAGAIGMLGAGIAPVRLQVMGRS